MLCSACSSTSRLLWCVVLVHAVYASCLCMLCMHCCPCIGILFTYAMSLFRHIVYLCHVLFFLYASFQSTLSRAQWSPQNTRTFCQLYVDEIDKGNCPRGQMSKWGWKNLTEGYFKATELVHDNIIFGSRVRQLKKEWNDLRKLYHKETGLGRNADGSISASAEWWKTNDKVQHNSVL